MLIESWAGCVRIIIVGVVACVGYVVLLRASGKRTLAKINAFDLIVTAASGSTLAMISLSNEIALVEGLLVIESSTLKDIPMNRIEVANEK